MMAMTRKRFWFDSRILGQDHFAELRTAQHHLFLRISDFQRRQHINHLTSYAEALTKAQCENVEVTIRNRGLLFAGAVQRTNNDVQGDDRCEASVIRPARTKLDPISGGRPQGFSSHGGIHAKHPFVVRSRGGVVPHCG